MLKIPVKDITSSGLTVHKNIAGSAIGLDEQEVNLRSPLDVEATLTRVGNTILSDVTVNALYGYQCARCLVEIEKSRLREYHFDYEINSPMDVVDLGEEIRQEMIMAIPQRVLCQKDCKGICAGCGVNLNIEKCKCK